MPYGPPPKTGAALLTAAMKAAGWTYQASGTGHAPGRYINTKTGQSQFSAPPAPGWTLVNTPAGGTYVSETGQVSVDRPTEPDEAEGPVAQTGGAETGGSSGRGVGGPSDKDKKGLTEAELQRRRRGRVQTNVTGGAVGAPSVAKKTLVGY